MGKDGNTAPSDRIVIAGVGIGNMGRGDLGVFLGRGDVQYVAVSDVKKDVRDRSISRINDRGMPQRKGHFLPEARDQDAPRRQADDRRRPALWSGRLRRQPACA